MKTYLLGICLINTKINTAIKQRSQRTLIYKNEIIRIRKKLSLNYLKHNSKKKGMFVRVYVNFLK